jgi:hypothetical protein
LGIHESASPDEAGRAYLRKLREQEFMPPCPLHGALCVFQQKPLPPAAEEQMRIEEETRLRAEVDAFADEFFRLLVAKRRECWKELLVRCQHLPSLSTRLQDLKGGLDVDVGGLPTEESLRGKLAAHLVESFPLPRLARAASRQAFLRTAAAELKSWEKAARCLRREWPAVAALDYEVVAQLSSLRWRVRRRDKMRRRNRRADWLDAVNNSKWGGLAVLLLISLVSGILKNRDKPSNSLYPPLTSLTPQQQFAIETADTPPTSELLDPAKFDVDLLDYDRVHFTARLGSGTTRPTDARPIALSKTTLILLGVPRADIDALFTRAAKANSPKSSPNSRPKSSEPSIPKPSNGGVPHQ